MTEHVKKTLVGLAVRATIPSVVTLGSIYYLYSSMGVTMPVYARVLLDTIVIGSFWYSQIKRDILAARKK